MALNDNEDAEKTEQKLVTSIGTPVCKEPIFLTPQEVTELITWLEMPHEALSTELKRAILNYKRLKAERL